MEKYEQTSATHRLKIVEPFTTAVRSGAKKFEIRKNDRSFKVGDILMLEPYCLKTKKHVVGESHYDINAFPMIRRISYMTDYEQKEGYVVLSLQHLD